MTRHADMATTLHIVSTRPEACGDFICRAYSIPGVSYWCITKTDDALTATSKLHPSDRDWYRPGQWQLRHDGLIGATFRTLKLARAAGVAVAAVWDEAGMPEPGSGVYGKLSATIWAQPGRC